MTVFLGRRHIYVETLLKQYETYDQILKVTSTAMGGQKG